MFIQDARVYVTVYDIKGTVKHRTGKFYFVQLDCPVDLGNGFSFQSGYFY